MVSESALMNSADRARLRVPAPAVSDRTIVVVALDEVGDGVVARLAQGQWRDVAFFPSWAVPGASMREAQVPATVPGLLDQAGAADLVVMVAGDGGGAAGAAVIGETCSQRRVMTTAVVVHASDADEGGLSATLAQVRPWSLMVVVAAGGDYVEDILRSFR